jgi:hypoxanthine phosphoribosyltransferase
MVESTLKRNSWENYGEECEKIYKEVSDYILKKKIKIDAIIPILRGAMTLDSFLAYRLKILRILPVQYKYFFVSKNKAELRQILFTPSKEIIKTKNPTFLVVEGDQCYGNTVITTIKDLKKEFPNCKILHAADCVDHKYKEVIKDTEAQFYGRYTNHCEELSKEECDSIGIDFESTIAPWENQEEENATIEGKQFIYEDLKKVKEDSKEKMDINF